jgi:HipA-like protein
MLAYLNRDEELPHRRDRLYQRTIERMADQWDANKQLSAGSTTARFSLDHKTRFLRRLAWQMMNDAAHGQGNAIHERALHKFSADFCEQTYGEDPDAARRTADELLQHLRERNYVLTLLGGRLFGFVHKTFLEYLAATEIHARFRSQEWGIGELGRVFQDHWHEDAWTETLTLVCGIIEEDRPEQVVEVLQQVAMEGAKWTNVERVAYVAFAIRCLAEIDQIEQEPVRSFAVRLTELLKHELTASDTLGWGPTADPVLPALRLHAGQWPGFELLRRWTKDDAVARRSMFYTSAYQCAIAAGGTEWRLALLRDALSTDRSYTAWVIQEASALGPWRREEIDALMEMSASKNDLDKLTILSRILPQVSDHAGLIQAIVRLAELSEHEHVRCQAAGLLLDANRECEVAERALLALLGSSELGIPIEAARTLASAGLGSKAIPVLVDGLLSVPLFAGACAATLLSLAEIDSEAEKALGELGPKLEAIEDSALLAAICSNIAVTGLTDIAEGALSKRLDSKPGADGVVHVASAMVAFPATQVRGLQALEQRYDSTKSEEIGSMIVNRALNLETIEGASERLLMKIMSTASEDTLRASAAQAILYRSTNGEIRTAAQQMLTLLTQPAVDERARLRAAHSLGPEQSADVFLDLARSAESESIRKSAAHAVRDPSVLAELAGSVQDEQVRREANSSLTSLKLLKALVQVGKPRQGRVRLSGKPVGILEETRTGGSRFLYDRAYLDLPDAIPISPTIPLRKEPYESPGLHPFFKNLLPEGWLLDLTCRKLGLSHSDKFGLLLATGADCMGAVEVVPADDEAA